jgi:predicted SnoaL-like aldol condensation-catalyzing enzyme
MASRRSLWKGDQAMKNIEKVQTIFANISAGDIDLAMQYIDPKRFVQHNPYVAAGVEGLKEFIRQSPRDQLRFTVVRAIQDGPYVVTQGTRERQGRDVFFEIFRFEEGLVVEHWAFSAEGAPPNQSGHTQTDGPTQPKPSEYTEKSKAFVRHYYETVHISRDESDIQQYFSGDHCIRHEPGVRDGVAAFLSDMHRLIKNRTIDDIKLALGQGDFVFIAAKGTHEGEPCVYIDLYRVEDGKIAERWGLSEQVPPQAQWKHTNGML